MMLDLKSSYNPREDVPRTKDDALAQLDYIASMYGNGSLIDYREKLRRIHGLLTDEIPEFVRDHSRYIVIKTKDLSPTQRLQISDFLTGHKIPLRTAVVIEADWPEYEPTWNLLADRIQKEQAEQAPATNPQKPANAYCPSCKKYQTHHGDPDSVHLHLCDVCDTPVEY